jgi:hypothetical protein
MIAGLTALACLAAFLALYPFAVYPASLRLLPHRPVARGRPLAPDEPITLCFCAYNEEAVLAQKLENIRDLKLRHPGLRVLAYVDAATDNTAAILEEAADAVEVIVAPARRGKTHGMNHLVARATSELVVFTDANVIFDAEALGRLTSYFADPSVGCVCGHLVYLDERTATARMNSLQWRIEEQIKERESETGSVVGADGSIFAIRRRLHRPVPDDLIDDFHVSLSILCDGYRVIHADDVLAFEAAAAHPFDEFRRKIRIACQAVNVHWALWPRVRRLDPVTLYKYLAHRVLRWLCPFLLLAAAILASAALVLLLSPAPAAVLIVGGMIVFALAVRLRLRPFTTVATALLAFTGVGLGVLRSLVGDRFQTWQPAASVRHTADERVLAGCKVVYLAHDRNDARVRLRVGRLAAIAGEVVCFAFRREKIGDDRPLPCPIIELGVTRDCAYVARAFSVLTAAIRLWRHRRALAGADLLIGRNLEPALLCLVARRLAGGEIPIVYEALDVHRFLVGNAPLNRAFRLLERFLLRRVQVLAVSSPAFMEHHYTARQGYRGAWYLLENKLPASIAAGLRSADARVAMGPAGPVWTIGWFGMLRCMRSFELLLALAAALPDQVRVLIRGYPTEVDPATFRARCTACPNVTYAGPYRHPDDLQETFGAVDLVWAIDYYDVGANSDWLLPNRLYEAGCLRVPLLARAGTATGGHVRLLGLGWVLPEPMNASLESFIRGLTLADYLAVRRQMASRPAWLFVDFDEMEHLCHVALAAGEAPLQAPTAAAASSVLGRAAREVARQRSQPAE